MRANMQVRNDVSHLQLQLSDQNLQLIQEYEQRILVNSIRLIDWLICNNPFSIKSRSFNDKI